MQWRSANRGLVCVVRTAGAIFLCLLPCRLGLGLVVPLLARLWVLSRQVGCANPQDGGGLTLGLRGAGSWWAAALSDRQHTMAQCNKAPLTTAGPWECLFGCGERI